MRSVQEKAAPRFPGAATNAWLLSPAAMTPPAVMTRVAIRDVAHPMRAVVAVMARVGAIHDAPHMRTVIVVRVAVGDAPHVGPVIITVVDRAISCLLYTSDAADEL